MALPNMQCKTKSKLLIVLVDSKHIIDASSPEPPALKVTGFSLMYKVCFIGGTV
jgi:hypothetical protein